MAPPVAPLRALRSSFIVSCRAFLRELQAYERYEAQLAADDRAALDGLASGIWVPVALARAHLVACDALGFSEAVEVNMGRQLARRLHNPMLNLAIRIAGVAGATPMFLAAKAVQMWPQRNDGGDLVVAHKTKTSARVELVGYTLADIRHVRRLWRGTLDGNARLVMPRASVSEVSSACRADRLVYEITW